MEGWVKIHRKIWKNPVVTKDPDHLAVWVWLLTHAAAKETDVVFQGKRITLQPGQLVTSLRIIAEEVGVNRQKVSRIINSFKSETQIETRTTASGTLISIDNWQRYQQKRDTKRYTSVTPAGHECDTNKKVEEGKEVVVDARARTRTREDGRWLSDRLSDDEWKRLDRQFEDLIGLVNRIDDQVTKPAEIQNPYRYYLQVANNMDWPRKR